MNFIRTAAACPVTKVADVEFNVKNIKECIDLALNENSKLIVFPELSITSYSCGDLFSQKELLDKSDKAIQDLCNYSREKDIMISVGAPLLHNYSLYNCAYIIYSGKILGIIPKIHIPNYSEFYEKRWFAGGKPFYCEKIHLTFQKYVPFGTNLIFKAGDINFSFEICEDLWAAIPPSSYLSLMGANIIGNLSASNEIVSKSQYRKELVSSQSAKNISAYVYSSSGVHESTTDLLFSGHLIISENGSVIKENERFQRHNEIITSIIDIDKLNHERMKNLSFRDSMNSLNLQAEIIPFEFKDPSIKNFDRRIEMHPFVPSDEKVRKERCEEIFKIQASALAKRLEHTSSKKVVLGISGGLDSTLALLVAVKTFELLDYPMKNILTITMPGFGTTDRTYKNAVNLCKELGTTFKEINIVDACLQHFKGIGHNPDIHDVTYENVQARERTQILMDIANKERGILIGTGDLSELALGWCTYNGDHMSMYSVNSSIPKTLVRYLVQYAAEYETYGEISDTLMDILGTPVSPELLPKDKKGEISQKTEDIIGPYELHDFFLYYFIRQGADNDKIIFLANHAFKNIYDEETIKKWFEVFIKRFFSQQFKRSALPDGPKVGSVGLSPRGDWRMPSDASSRSFL